MVDLTEHKSAAFGAIFAAAGAMRLAGLFFLQRMHFPPSVTEKREAPFALSDTIAPFLNRSFRSYMLFVGIWGLFLNMGLPFYTVYLIRDLSFDVGHTVVLSTLATLGGILTLHSWGLLSDRFGSKPVQFICSYSWILIGLIGWSLSGPNLQRHLYLVYLVIGGATAGFQLTQFNLMLKLIPEGMGSFYIAIFLAVTSAFTALGPVFGGMLLALTPPRFGVLFGQPIMDYHFLFLVSFMGCLSSLPFLASVHEPASDRIQSVWRSMWRMRSFNPLLAITNAAGFLVTPRGMLSLAHYSIRSLRKELRRVLHVATELLSRRQTVIKERL